MTVTVSRRVQRVKPSPTLNVSARAARLRAQAVAEPLEELLDRPGLIARRLKFSFKFEWNVFHAGDALLLWHPPRDGGGDADGLI